MSPPSRHHHLNASACPQQTGRLHALVDEAVLYNRDQANKDEAATHKSSQPP